MQETMINFLAVVICGNLGLLAAWAAGGIIYHFVKSFKEDLSMLRIAMYERKRIRTLRDIGWANYGMPHKTLPAGWEGEIERLRPGSVSTLPEQFVICDRYLTDEYVREVTP